RRRRPRPGASRASWRDARPVGETRGVVATETALREESPTRAAVPGRLPDVVDDAEGRPGGDIGSAQVDIHPARHRPPLPLPVWPVRVARVPRPGLEQHVTECFDLDGERRPSPAEVDRGADRPPRARGVVDLEFGPPELLD